MKTKKPSDLSLPGLLTLYWVLLMLTLSLQFILMVLLVQGRAPHNAVILFSSVTLLLVLIGALFFFFWGIHPMIRVTRKLREIRDEMPDDPFWQDIKGPDMTTQVLQNIDALFQRVKSQAGRDYQAELLNRQAEFSALQSQINPHFLYNTLDSIRGQALIDGADEIADMTEALSTFFRYSVSQTGALVSLGDELSNVENYFHIQQFRFSDRFDYEILTEDPEALTYQIPKLTIQPIVENSIFHGLETKLEKGHIVIRVTLTEKRLIIDISDDGSGMDRQTLEQMRHRIEHGVRAEDQTLTPSGRRTGIAMSNVNQRIRLFFGPEYGITVSSTPRLGTTVQVVIPRRSPGSEQAVNTP